MQQVGLWGEDRRVAVAVSGGPDSLCLAMLAKRWGRPLALIVDHRLRPDSTNEAREAEARLGRMDIPSRVLTLHDLPHGPALAQRARDARYAALGGAMREAGLSDLLLGHHAGDQAETVLMRGQARSGPSGLAGMGLVSETDTCRLVRPLLGVRPEAMRVLLVEAGIGWADDPSNRDQRALRPRLRRILDDDPPATAALLRQASKGGAARALQEREVARILAHRATIHPEGFATISPGPIMPEALGALLRSLSGAPYPPASESLARLAASPAPGTLHGVQLLPAGRLGPGLLLVREAAAMQSPVAARPGILWDRRFRIAHDVLIPGDCWLGALGDETAGFRRHAKLPAAVLRTLPALRRGDSLLAVPHIGYFNGWTLPSGGLTLRLPLPVSGAPFARAVSGDAEAAGTPHVA